MHESGDLLCTTSECGNVSPHTLRYRVCALSTDHTLSFIFFPCATSAEFPPLIKPAHNLLKGDTSTYSFHHLLTFCLMKQRYASSLNIHSHIFLLKFINIYKKPIHCCSTKQKTSCQDGEQTPPCPLSCRSLWLSRLIISKQVIKAGLLVKLSG